MKYFQLLPKVTGLDASGNKVILTNLMVRANMIQSVLKNPMLYYTYNVKDGETPEIISSRYYGSPDDFWVIMFSNQLMDPQWDWPLSDKNLMIYITEKYGSIANAQSEITYYEKTVKKTDKFNTLNETETIVIDETEYLNTQQGTTTGNFSDGDEIYITVSAGPVTAYENEVRLNESKRNIKLLNVNYLNTLHEQFKKLMAK